MNKLSSSQLTQLEGSIEKLFHYLLACVTQDVTVYCEINDKQSYIQDFKAPRQIVISPSLYTRIDDCHGAGNCCRVPFDLVYTDYDRQRILSYDHKKVVKQFGVTAGAVFQENRRDLLDSLEPLRVAVTYDILGTGSLVGFGGRETQIWVRLNSDVQPLSGRTSCPYLFRGDDRYYCGAHPFKPLHCWFPHMTIRSTQSRAASGHTRSSVSIGRAQYGRNHNFGCPVIFIESGESAYPREDIWPAPRHSVPNNYFDQQFQDDVDKLEWASKSTESLGFDRSSNAMVGMHDTLLSKQYVIERALASNIHSSITVWRYAKVSIS